MCQVNLDDHNLFSSVSYIQLLLCMSFISTLFASNSSNRFYARKILKNQTLILIVWCSVRNSTSRNRKIYMTPSVGLPAQMVVCFNPEQLFPIQ